MPDLEKIDFDAIYDSLSPDEQRTAGILGLKSAARLGLLLTLKVKEFFCDLSGNAGDQYKKAGKRQDKKGE